MNQPNKSRYFFQPVKPLDEMTDLEIEEYAGQVAKFMLSQHQSKKLSADEEATEEDKK